MSYALLDDCDASAAQPTSRLYTGWVREVASFIPGAMRGLASERQLGSYYDLDLARRGLTNAIVTYVHRQVSSATE